jgi:hypothetical protein
VIFKREFDEFDNTNKPQLSEYLSRVSERKNASLTGRKRNVYDEGEII